MKFKQVLKIIIKLSNFKNSIFFKNMLVLVKKDLYLHSEFVKREHSSAGSEHLPYKQGVTGSNPVAPTTKSSTYEIKCFFYCPFLT